MSSAMIAMDRQSNRDGLRRQGGEAFQEGGSEGWDGADRAEAGVTGGGADGRVVRRQRPSPGLWADQALEVPSSPGRL